MAWELVGLNYRWRHPSVMIIHLFYCTVLIIIFLISLIIIKFIYIFRVCLVHLSAHLFIVFRGPFQFGRHSWELSILLISVSQIFIKIV